MFGMSCTGQTMTLSPLASLSARTASRPGAAAAGLAAAVVREPNAGNGEASRSSMPGSIKKSPRAGEVASRRLRSEHRSEEHRSELQSRSDLVCRLLLEKKKKQR